MKKTHYLTALLFTIITSFHTEAQDFSLERATVKYDGSHFIISGIKQLPVEIIDEIGEGGAGLNYLIITGDGNYISAQINSFNEEEHKIPYAYENAGPYTFYTRLTKTYSPTGPRTIILDGAIAESEGDSETNLTQQLEPITAIPNDAVPGDNTTIILRLNKVNAILSSTNNDVTYKLIGEGPTMEYGEDGTVMIRANGATYAFLDVQIPDDVADNNLQFTGRISKTFRLPLAVQKTHDPNNLVVYPVCSTLKRSNGLAKMDFNIVINFENTGISPENSINVLINKHSGLKWPAILSNLRTVVKVGGKTIPLGSAGNNARYKIVNDDLRLEFKLKNVNLQGINTNPSGAPQTKGYITFTVPSRLFNPNSTQRILKLQASIGFANSTPPGAVINTNRVIYSGASVVAFCKPGTRPIITNPKQQKPRRKK